MSIAIKAILIFLFFSLIVVFFSMLPLVSDYPLDPLFASSVAIIIQYTYAWISIFWAINYLMYCVLLSLSIEVALFLWRLASWVVGLVARMIG